MATLFEKYYSVKPGARLKSDPQAAGQYLEQLEQRLGRLTPKAVARAVETANARGQATPIHRDFTWNKKAAVAKCHEMEAGYLIRAIEVVVERDGKQVIQKPVRAFVSVVQHQTSSYVDVVTVLSNAQLRKQMLQAAWHELEEWRDRYRQYQECVVIFQTPACKRLRVVAASKKPRPSVRSVLKRNHRKLRAAV